MIVSRPILHDLLVWCNVVLHRLKFMASYWTHMKWVHYHKTKARTRIRRTGCCNNVSSLSENFFSMFGCWRKRDQVLWASISLNRISTSRAVNGGWYFSLVEFHTVRIWEHALFVIDMWLGVGWILLAMFVAFFLIVGKQTECIISLWERL